MLAGIDHLVIAVKDLEAARKSYTALDSTVVEGGHHTGIGTDNWYAAVLGARGEGVTRPDLGGAGTRFRIGPHTFDFFAPAGAAAIKDWLAARGASPYAATVRAAGAARGPLDPARTHGAQLSCE